VNSEEKLFKKLRRIPWEEMRDKYNEFYFKEYLGLTEKLFDLKNYMKKEEAFFDEHGWTMEEFIRESNSRYTIK
jgi:hypothetical protein